MRRVGLLFLLVLLAAGIVAGCVRPGPMEYHRPETWRLAAALFTTTLSCWLTHRLLNRLKGPGADDPLFPEWPRSPWYLPPFWWEYTFSSGLLAFKWLFGGVWFLLWLWFFGLLDGY